MAHDDPRPGHKYRSRKRHKGRWIYDYGKGFPSAAGAGKGQEPPEGTLVFRPGEATPQKRRRSAPVKMTREEVAAAVNAAVARLHEEKNRKAQMESPAGDLSGLFPPDRAEPIRLPASRQEVKPPGSKEDLMRQVQAVGRWTSASLGQSLERFRRDTGFQMTALEPGKRAGPNRVRATKEAATCLLAVRHLLNVGPGMTSRLKINVIASGKRAMATYSSGQAVHSIFGISEGTARSQITIHDKNHGHNLLHEFGHFLDHYTGNPDKAQSFASNVYGSPMHQFVQAIKGSDSYDKWHESRPGDQVVIVGGTPVLLNQASARVQRIMANRNARHLDYVTRPQEMVARFFDCWAHWKLGQKGFDTAALGTKPDYSIGGYSDEDIKKLSPLFEKALGEHLTKSVLRALKDLVWLAKARGAPVFD